MKKTIRETVPERTTEKDIIYCDLCGIELANEQNEDTWERNHGTLSYAEGSFHGCDEDCREKYKIDLCMKCTRDKVMPLVEDTFNVKRRRTD